MRGTALLVLVPLLLLMLTIGRPGPYPASALPPSFDGSAATGLAAELATDFPTVSQAPREQWARPTG